MVGTLPGYRERCDGARTGPADSVHLGIFGDVVLFAECRQEFLGDYPRVSVIERIVLGGPIRVSIAPVSSRWFRLIRPAAGVDKHSDHHRDFAAIDEIIHYILRPYVAFLILEGVSILKDHQSCRNRRVVLRGHIDPVGVLGAGKDRAGKREWTTDFALRHTFLWLRIRS